MRFSAPLFFDMSLSFKTTGSCRTLSEVTQAEVLCSFQNVSSYVEKIGSGIDTYRSGYRLLQHSTGVGS